MGQQQCLQKRPFFTLNAHLIGVGSARSTTEIVRSTAAKFAFFWLWIESLGLSEDDKGSVRLHRGRRRQPLIRHCGFRPWPLSQLLSELPTNSLAWLACSRFLFATKKSIYYGRRIVYHVWWWLAETPLKIDRKVSQTGLQKRAGHSLPPKGGFMATFVTR